MSNLDKLRRLQRRTDGQLRGKNGLAGYQPKPVRRTTVTVQQCVAVSQETGVQCKSKTGDSTRLCVQHRQMAEEKSNDKILKCHRCMRTIWKDAKEQIPDVEKTRLISCPKAFWRSNGDKKRWMRDLCWYDIQTYSIDYNDSTTVFQELIGIVRDERLRLDQTRRYMADEGGLLTPDYIRMMQQHFGHLETLYKLQNGVVTGPFGNLRNAPSLAPAGSESKLGEPGKKSLLEALFTADDGMEELEVRKTTVESETFTKKKQKPSTIDADYTATAPEQEPTSEGTVRGESSPVSEPEA